MKTIHNNIYISQNAGYCMGVKNAFLKSFKLAESINNLCVYGEMVHNRFALEELVNSGVQMKKTIKELITSRECKNVIIRAHGISPEEENILISHGKNIYDMTCPIVKKVQLLAQKYSSEGHTIIIFGKKNHPEVIGIKGYCENNNYTIKTLEEVNELRREKIINPVLISQTTMNSNLFEKVVSEIKKIFSKIIIINTLCNAPIKMQEEAFKLSQKMNAMLIVGDKMSANTNTLFEKIKEICPTWFIEKSEDLDLEQLKKYKNIGIAGGASTPTSQIDLIKNYLQNNLSVTR